MRLQTNTSNLPDFIVRSTFGVTLVSVLLLTPFGIFDIIQGLYILGFLTLLISLLCAINAWICFQGRYILPISLFGISPAIIVTVAFALFKLGVVGSYWAFLAVLALYFILPEKWAWIANSIFVAIIIPVAWNILEHPVAIRFSGVLLGISFFALLSMREITKQHYMLKKQAITDTLTGLYNRSLLQYSLEQAIQQSHRTNTPITLIMLDIDHFKKINDEYGHEVGDSVLKSLGELLKNHFRGSDLLFRIGGEEFLVLVYNTDELKALDMAEKIRAKIAQLSLPSENTVTVSIGISGIQRDIGWKEWMKICDEKMYCAKSNGRNQVYI